MATFPVTPLMAALGPSSLVHRSTMLGDRSIVGVVVSPVELVRLPVDAFVLPSTGVEDALLRRCLSGVPRNILSAVRHHPGPIFARGAFGATSFLFVPKIEKPVSFALEYLASEGVESFGFLKPDLAALAGGLLAFEQENPTDLPSEILIPFPDEGRMKDFFETLRPLETFCISKEDPDREAVAAYLDDRSRPSLRGPRRIASYELIADLPFHLSGRRGRESGLEPVDLWEPAPGRFRPYTDSLLDRAMGLVPSFVTTPARDLPPPFVYARFAHRSLREKRMTDAAGRERAVDMFASISETAFAIQIGATGEAMVVGEIGLLDLPRREFEHSDMLFHAFFGQACPYELAELAHAFSGESMVPASLLETIKRRARRAESFDFSAEQMDLMLLHQILHECAEIFWSVIPPAFRERWAGRFPLNQEDESRGAYFRNRLRIHMEDVEEDPSGFFASETFSDILALYWAGDALPDVLRALNDGLVSEHRAFFDEVMEWAERRRDAKGSVFVLDRKV